MAQQKRKILVADDDRLTRQVIVDTLRRADYVVFDCVDGLDAVQTFQRQHPDLVLLDIMMPRLDGFSVCRKIREQSQVPIVMLTVRGATDDVVRGLEAGADDYLVKGMHPRELVARINALVRRNVDGFRGTGAPVVKVAGVEIDPQRRRVLVEGNEARLSPTEFGLLYFLASRPGEVFDRQLLFRRVWGSEWLGNTNLIDVCVRRLRQKIEPDPAEPHYIRTVRGVGYGFTDDATADAASAAASS
ncbi:MAG: response regulator transcription factor [Chloroflexi bacterium]|nr:response regulator transcription factor [Chloroflexota bacterium]